MFIVFSEHDGYTGNINQDFMFRDELAFHPQSLCASVHVSAKTTPAEFEPLQHRNVASGDTNLAMDLAI